MDPRGEIREFSYQSGVPCDPASKARAAKKGQQPTRASKTGYYDYSDNKFVLPDGRRVKVVVNKANRARG